MKDEILYSLESLYKKANKTTDEKEKQSFIFRYLVELDRVKTRIASYINRKKLTQDDFNDLKSIIEEMNNALGLITHKLSSNYFS